MGFVSNQVCVSDYGHFFPERMGSLQTPVGPKDNLWAENYRNEAAKSVDILAQKLESILGVFQGVIDIFFNQIENNQIDPASFYAHHNASVTATFELRGKVATKMEEMSESLKITCFNDYPHINWTEKAKLEQKIKQYKILLSSLNSTVNSFVDLSNQPKF